MSISEEGIINIKSKIGYKIVTIIAIKSSSVWKSSENRLTKLHIIKNTVIIDTTITSLDFIWMCKERITINKCKEKSVSSKP